MMESVPGIWSGKTPPCGSTPCGELKERAVSLECEIGNTGHDTENNHRNEWEQESGKGQPAIPACRSDIEIFLHYRFNYEDQSR